MASLPARSQLQTRAVGASRRSAVARNVRVSAGRTALSLESTDQAEYMSRRNAVSTGFIATANFLANSPAQAFLGFGDPPLTEQYATETSSILSKVRSVLALPRGDETTEGRVKDLRKEINSWVAKYRREPQFSGKPSYGNTYSVLNALAGHFNSFGATAPIPKKRLERIVKEIDDAEKQLSRGR